MCFLLHYNDNVFVIKDISNMFYLLIAEAVARILGTSEKIIKSGSTLQLHCILKQTTEEPQFIFW